MDNEEPIDDFVEGWAWWQIIPPYIRGVLGWNSMYASKGIPFILEGFYIWFGKRMPPGMVFYATHQLVEYARENNMETDAILEAQSNWLIDKM
jgi:hypothetical protein